MRTTGAISHTGTGDQDPVIGATNKVTGAVAIVLGLVQGVGFGLLFLNTPVAIVAYLVLPTVFNLVGSMVAGARDALPWLDLTAATRPLFAGRMTATDWAHVGTSSLLWVALPTLVGMWRVHRSEIR